MMTQTTTRNGIWKLGVLLASFALTAMFMLAGTSTAFATHNAIKDKGSLGDNAATTLIITGATSKTEEFQFGTYDDPYGELKINEKEIGAYASRDCFVRNDTKYNVKLTLQGVAQTNYKSFKWAWFSNDQSGAGTVKSEGTKKVTIVNTILHPGQQIHFFATATNKSDVRLAVHAVYKFHSEIAKLQTKKPIVSATKLASDKVEVCVSLPDASKGAVSGVSKLDLYQNGKKVKSWTYSAQTPIRKYTAKGSAATKAKFKVTSTTIDEGTQKLLKNDSITSDTVKPQANVLVISKKKPKLKDYEFNTFVATKLSYSGKKLVVEGYTVNTEGFKMSYPLTIQVSSSSKSLQLGYYQDWQHSWAKGVKKIKVTISKNVMGKAVKVVNLRAGDIHVD